LRLTISLTLIAVASLVVFIEGVRPKMSAPKVQLEVVAVSQSANTNVSTRDLKCLAENIYHEARGEGFYGMLAVANVTLNRLSTKGFPDTLCEVVHQPSQFSWTLMRDQLGIYEKVAYAQSVEIAKYALTTGEDITGGALFFHTVQLKRPKWARSYEEAIIINNHIFYKGK
jgi:N-acetylmuramoyl-L-alanine amidase